MNVTNWIYICEGLRFPQVGAELCAWPVAGGPSMDIWRNVIVYLKLEVLNFIVVLFCFEDDGNESLQGLLVFMKFGKQRQLEALSVEEW